MLANASLHTSYSPNFVPVSLGGYFWMVFSSQRTYGNTLTDINPATRPNQLWVSAIDRSWTVGADPSHPAFWLPGQDITTQNLRGQWALAPCQSDGATCNAGFACCSGSCRGATGARTCTSMATGCAPIGDSCKVSTDCCDSMAACIGGFCAK